MLELKFKLSTVSTLGMMTFIEFCSVSAGFIDPIWQITENGQSFGTRDFWYCGLLGPATFGPIFLLYHVTNWSKWTGITKVPGPKSPWLQNYPVPNVTRPKSPKAKTSPGSVVLMPK